MARDSTIRFEPGWFRLGLAVAVVQAAFLVVLLRVLELDRELGLAVAAVVGTFGAIALVVYVQFRFRNGG